MQIDPNHLAALSGILRHGSFEAAAHVLGVTGPAISQRIRALEEHLGGPVLTRGTPPKATALGQRLAIHAAQLSLLENDLARDLGQTARAPVRVAVNADSLDTWFLPALAGLDLEIEIVVDDQTRSADWLRRGEVSAAVTAQSRPVQGCDVRPLGTLRYVGTASPGFIDTWFRDGRDARAFARAPMLRYSAQDRLQHDWAAQVCGVSPTPPLVTLPSTRGFVEGCCLGLGWGLNPAHLVEEQLSQGTLRKLDPTPWDIPLFWQVSRIVTRPLRGLTQAVQQQAKRHLRPT